MRRKKSRPTLNQIANIVVRLERDQLAEEKIRAQIKKLTSALPADEVREVPNRDTAVEVAVHNGLIVVGRKLPVAQSMLIESLHTDPRVRRQLATVLATIAVGDPKLEDLLYDLGSHEVPAVRLAVIEALGRDAEPVVAAERLIRLLSRVVYYPDTHDRLTAQIVWHAMESTAVCELLLRSIREQSDAGRRTMLMNVLHKLAAVDQAFVAWVIDQRDDEDHDLRSRISYVIAESPLLPKMFWQLGAAAESRHVQLLRYVLGEVGDENRSDLVPLCQQALQDSDEGVRCGALLALWRLGPVAIGVFEDVRQAFIDDPSVVNRTLAAKAMAAIDTRRARHEATQLVADAHARGDDAQRFAALIREAYAVPLAVAR